MEVVFKEGLLYRQGAKFGKKIWRRTWLVLFQPSASGIGRVEMYNVREGSACLQTKHPPRRAERMVVRLCDCLSVTPVPEESCPPECTAFSLNTTKRTYTMASETGQDWMEALCLLAFQREPSGPDTRSVQRVKMLSMEDNELYSTWQTAQYKITVQSTEASRRCGLAGDYLLSPETDSLRLLDLFTGQTVYCWPYHLLRRFGCHKGVFSIEAGRRCPSGEGQFSFLSQHAAQIHKAVEEAIAQYRLEQDAKPHPWTPNLPSEPTASDCLQDSRGSLSDYPDRLTSPQQPARGSPITCPHTEPEPEPDCELYATIDHSPQLKRTNQEPAPPRLQRRSLLDSSLGWEADAGEEERCLSLESFTLEDVREESPYYNLKTWVEGEGVAERDSPRSDCIVGNAQSQYQSQPQSQSQSQFQYQPQPQSQSQSQPQFQFTWNPTPQLQSPPRPKRQPLTPTKPNRHLQPLSQPKPRPRSQGGVDTCWSEMAEAQTPSPTINPTEIPPSFKLKLTNLLSKDLARLQPPTPSAGRDSSSFHPY